MDDRLIAIQERMKEILRSKEGNEQCEGEDSIPESTTNKENPANENNWLLEKWREISIPEWRRILQESIEKNDTGREKYARWMLKEMLDDSEYREEE